MAQAYDVFISHSSIDFAQADALRAALEEKGVRCWIAPRNILPGADYGPSIVEAVKTTPKMVLIFSSNAVNSDYVASEVEMAMEAKATILPVRIENVALGGLEFYLRRRQWIDAHKGNFENHLGDVLRELMRILQQKPQSVPVASVQPAEPEEVELEELPTDAEVKQTQEASAKLAQSGRVPFEQVWQAFIKKVEGNRKWLLPGLGWSEYRVSFTRRGSAIGESGGGAGTTYSAAKNRVEQVWVGMSQDTKVTSKAIQEIIGNSAPTGFVGAIVEELRRLEAELQPGAPASGEAPTPASSPVAKPAPPTAPVNPDPEAFEAAWQALRQKVKSDRKWRLSGLRSSEYRVSFESDGSVSGESGGSETVYNATKSAVQQAWAKLGRDAVVTHKAVQDILGQSASTGFIGAIIKELRNPQATPQPNAGPKSGPQVLEPVATPANASHDVFISHSSKDAAKADALRQALEAQGMKC